jgi:polyprenyl-phospho-N-acetylgalactosaminyl synthase
VSQSSDIKLWVVVAAFNEAATIDDVLADLRTIPCQTVVVDDGSTDNTAGKAVAAGATVLRHVVNLGQGAALQTGIDYALQEGASHIGTLDADGQHAAESVTTLLEKLRESNSDIAVGSRALGTSVGMPRSRSMIIKAAVWFTRLHSGLPITDTHNGLRVMTRCAAEKIRIHQPRMAHASEIMSQIREHSLRFVEAPVTITYTEYSMRKGQSVLGALKILLDLFYARWSK